MRILYSKLAIQIDRKFRYTGCLHCISIVCSILSIVFTLPRAFANGNGVTTSAIDHLSPVSISSLILGLKINDKIEDIVTDN